jgi:hypothetical protein
MEDAGFMDEVLAHWQRREDEKVPIAHHSPVSTRQPVRQEAVTTYQ